MSNSGLKFERIVEELVGKICPETIGVSGVISKRRWETGESKGYQPDRELFLKSDPYMINRIIIGCKFQSVSGTAPEKIPHEITEITKAVYWNSALLHGIALFGGPYYKKRSALLYVDECRRRFIGRKRKIQIMSVDIFAKMLKSGRIESILTS